MDTAQAGRRSDTDHDSMSSGCPVTHLYNAMQQLQMLKAPWVYMETLQKCFEEHDLYLAGTETREQLPLF